MAKRGRADLLKLLLTVFALCCFLPSSGFGQTTRVSVASDGSEVPYGGVATGISSDGRYVVFSSGGDNLVSGDTNNYTDVFVRDRQTGQTARVSVASDGSEGNGNSSDGIISADGRFVVFLSQATNLASAGVSNWPPIYKAYLHDRQTGETILVSSAPDGTFPKSDCKNLSISADGRYIVYESSAMNILPLYPPPPPSTFYLGLSNIYLYDRLTRKTSLVGVPPDGFSIKSKNHYPAISADGRFISFSSYNIHLVPDDINVYDRHTGETSRVGVASAGVRPSISADGRYVTFISEAGYLVANDNNNVHDVFLHDRQTGETICVSTTEAGVPANSQSYWHSVSADGRFVAFSSFADDIFSGDTNLQEDVFVWDRLSRTTARVSVASDGTQANEMSSRPMISADGRSIIFSSVASNLVSSDTNISIDGFLHQRTNAICDPINFTDRTNVPLNTAFESNFVVVSCSFDADISIAGGEYSIDNGPYTANPGVISSGQTVRVRLVSAGIQNETALATVIIGGRIAFFRATTISVAKIGVFLNGAWYSDVSADGIWSGVSVDTFHVNFGSALGAKPVMGDWDGTGAFRIGVFWNGQWYLDLNGNGAWNGSGADRFYPNFGSAPGTIPVVGDWNGSGTSKIGVFLNGAWYLDLNGNGAWDGSMTDRYYPNFGSAPGAIPVVGDWNGSGTSKVGVFWNGQWYLDLNGNGTWDGIGTDRFIANFGSAPGAIPVVGDWNGSGTSKVGVFWNGRWYLDLNGSGTWDGIGTDRFIANFGSADGAIPVVGK